MAKLTSWLSRSQLDALDTKLFQYKDVDKMIALRRLELESRIEHNLERVKSSFVANRPEQLAIKFDSDIVLQNLYLFRSTVEECYSSLPQELKVIFKKRWMEGKNTWPEIEEELCYSKKYIYRKRAEILERYAEFSGETKFKIFNI